MNREIVGESASIYPLQGDVVSQAGSNTVTVAGLQGTPVAPYSGFSGGEELQYNINTNNWEPTLRASIQVNNVTVSDDPTIFVNVTKPVLVNGA